MRFNKALRIEYVGTNYAGWQWQTHSPSIQEELQKALAVIYKQHINLIGSGRTDSGVHSVGQVASFLSDIHIKDEALILGLNSLLPPDISVAEAWDVPLNFHAQRSAVRKTYLYKMHHSRVRSAFYSGRVWWVRGRVDFDRAQELLSVFEGTHDFTSCCAVDGLKENCVRTIYSTAFYREGDLYHLEVTGGGFLHNMVRIITGTVVKGCRSNFSTDRIREMLETKDRRKGGPTAPAEGLYLKKVYY